MSWFRYIRYRIARPFWDVVSAIEESRREFALPEPRIERRLSIHARYLTLFHPTFSMLYISKRLWNAMVLGTATGMLLTLLTLSLDIPTIQKAVAFILVGGFTFLFNYGIRTDALLLKRAYQLGVDAAEITAEDMRKSHDHSS